MAHARALIAAVTAVAAVTLTPAVATAAPGDPAPAALAAALAALRGQGYNVSGTVGSTAAGGNAKFDVAGSVDPASHAAAAEFKGDAGGDPVDINFVQTPDKLYAKIDISSIQSQLGVKPKQWVKVDESKLSSPDKLPFDLSGKTDAINLSGLMTSTAGVAYADPSHITGTVDLTAAKGPGAPAPSDLSDAGAAAKTTPFTATVDDQGRLTELAIDADGFDGNLSQDIHLSDYGSPATVTPPADSAVIPAPASLYPFFNN